MKKLKENLKDNEDGEELKDIPPENHSDEESNPGINNTEYHNIKNIENKMESYNKDSKSTLKRSSNKKACIYHNYYYFINFSGNSSFKIFI